MATPVLTIRSRRAPATVAHWLEYVDWASPILAEPLRIVDGNTMVPERPGNSLVWNDKAVARYRMA